MCEHINVTERMLDVLILVQGCVHTFLYLIYLHHNEMYCLLHLCKLIYIEYNFMTV